MDPSSWGKTSYVCPDHCPRLSAQFARNNPSPSVSLSVAGSVGEYRYQLVSVLVLCTADAKLVTPEQAQNLLDKAL